MVINVLIPRIDSVSDRHFYQASWGIFLIAGAAGEWFLLRFSGSSRWFIVMVAGVSILLGGYTVSRNCVYRSETALWEDTARKSPENPRAYNNLGYAYSLKGRKADARDAYRHALEIDPAFEHARNNLKMLDKQ
jgi:tetratricopeptide (TPR) repeat protein